MPQIVIIEEIIKEPDLSSVEEIEMYIRSKDWDDDTAVAIGIAESQLNPKAYNPEKHKGCAGSFSVMQVACIHFKAGENPMDVKTNIDKAYEIYKTQGFKPWTTYTSGKYKKFL